MTRLSLGFGPLFLVLGLASPVLASATPMAMPAAPLFGLAVSGAGVVSGVRIEIDCHGTDAFEPSASCSVRARADILATSLVTIAPIDGLGGSATLGGAQLIEPTAIEPGQHRELVALAVRDLSVSRDLREGWSIMPLILARHPLLADGPTVRREGGTSGFELIGCEGLTFDGPMVVDARDAGSVRVSIGGEVIAGEASVAGQCPNVSLDVGPVGRDDEILQQGGPVLSLGVRSALEVEDDGRFLLRVSYELGLLEHVALSLGVETDFDSLIESFVVEVGTPTLLIIVPSIAVGVGVVARQLGERDADAALRLRAGITFVSFGAGIDFDYWPVTGEWTSTVVGRLSI